MRCQLRTWCLALTSAVLCLAPAGCGGKDDEGKAGSETAVYWTGKASGFCKAPVKVGPAGEDAVARLLLQSRHARPGTALFVRIENLSSDRLSHGLGSLVEQRVDGRWELRKFEEDGRPIVFPALALQVPARSVSSCVEVPISSSWTVGKYRVRLGVEQRKPGEITNVILSGFFRVRDGSSAG